MRYTYREAGSQVSGSVQLRPNAAVGIARGRAIVALVIGAAPQELPSQLGRIEVVEIRVCGRRPPVGYWRHIGPPMCVTRIEKRPDKYRFRAIAAECGRGEVRRQHRVMQIRRRLDAARIAPESDSRISCMCKFDLMIDHPLAAAEAAQCIANLSTS